MLSQRNNYFNEEIEQKGHICCKPENLEEKYKVFNIILSKGQRNTWGKKTIFLAFVSAIRFLSPEVSLLPVYVSRDTLLHI